MAGGAISVRPTQPFGPRPPLGGKKIFQKEQPVMDKKPSLRIHIELYINFGFKKEHDLVLEKEKIFGPRKKFAYTHMFPSKHMYVYRVNIKFYFDPKSKLG